MTHGIRNNRNGPLEYMEGSRMCKGWEVQAGRRGWRQTLRDISGAQTATGGGGLALILPEMALSRGLTALTHQIRITLAAVLKIL